MPSWTIVLFAGVTAPFAMDGDSSRMMSPGGMSFFLAIWANKGVG